MILAVLGAFTGCDRLSAKNDPSKAAKAAPDATGADDAAKGGADAKKSDSKSGDTKAGDAKSGAAKGAPGAAERGPAPVKVAAAETKSMPLELENIATAESIATVEAKAAASQATAEASEASAMSAGEDIRAAEADIETAKLNLDYCVIKSPIAGRAGALQIHMGDIVKANDTNAMVTVAQLKPIYVSF